MKNTNFSFLIVLALFPKLSSAFQSDSTKSKILADITIVGQKSSADIHQMPQIIGTQIYAGKKSSLIVLNNVQGNVVTNTMRQVMAKIPGIFIWESDGSGIQIGIASRGLSPNRSWEFNVRQNGYDISADPYGYPEAYYNPQLQSVQRIEFVRGHGSLQYGPQMGGMVNYILKNGSEFTKPIQIETFQTLGSNGLFNTYNAVGGKTKKINYYSFFDHRDGNGWRDNNRYRSNTGSGSITFKPTDRLSFTTEFTRWEALSQQPGGLTDVQFEDNPQQSLRSRNWLNLAWQTLALTTDFNINDNNRLNVRFFTIAGNRYSVGFNPSSGILVNDTINTTTNKYNERAIDLDQYTNYGMEARYIHHYKIGRQESSLSAGARLYTGTTQRFRGGRGSSETDYDIQPQSGSIWNADINYESRNAAIFIENLFRISDKLVIIPGARVEYISAKATGYSGLSSGNPIYLQNQERKRSFLLGGIGAEFQITPRTMLYANGTQAYRPVQFADLTTPPTTDVVDPNLTDSKGLNLDFGYRGNWKDNLKFDVSTFYLAYNSRIGLIKQQRSDGSFYNFRTNVGASQTTGIEAFGEWDITKTWKTSPQYGELSWFASYAYNNAIYRNLRVVNVVGNTLQESNYKNKHVEYAPQNIFRTGLTYLIHNFSTTVQYSFTDLVFSDANNTSTPSANGQNGTIPSYSIFDFTISHKHKSGLSFKSGINNLTNTTYFTRRSGGYPGPGVLPADGRTFFITVGFTMK